jgi:hypothetical protein
MNTNNNKFDFFTGKEFTLEELNKFPTVNAMLDAKYGKEGTPTREVFDREADAYYQKYYCDNGCGCGCGNKEGTKKQNVLVEEEK